VVLAIAVAEGSATVCEDAATLGRAARRWLLGEVPLTDEGRSPPRARSFRDDDAGASGLREEMLVLPMEI
jgi:hypothetical protein